MAAPAELAAVRDNTNQQEFSVALSRAITADRPCVIFAWTTGSSPTDTMAISGGGVTWTKQATVLRTHRGFIFTSDGVAAPSGTTLTVDTGFAAATGLHILVYELPAGIGAPSTWQYATADGGSQQTSVTIPLAVAPAADSLGLAAAYGNETTVVAWPAGFTELTDGTMFTPTSTSSAAYDDTSAPQSVAATFAAAANLSGLYVEAKASVEQPASGYVGEVEADSPLHWWRLGEVSGNALDSAGSADGTVSGSPTRDVAGLINAAEDDGAIEFDGASGITASGKTPQAGAFSIEASIRPAALTDGFIGGGFPALLARASGNLQLLTFDSLAATQAGLSTSEPVLAVGEKLHIIATYDGTTARLILNGELMAEVAMSSDFGNDFRAIGWSGDDDWFSGTIDEFIDYDHALTLERAQAHYLASIANEFAGVGNFRAPAAQIESSGELTFSGSVSAQSDVPEVESSAEQVFSGAVTFHAPAAAFEGTGPDIDIAGVGIFHAPVPQLDGTGLIPYTGIGVFTVPTVQFEGTGFRAFVGAAIFHAPAATLEGTGAVTPLITTFSGIGTFHAPAATFSGSAVNAAVIREMLLYVDWDGTGFEPLDRLRLVSLQRNRGSGPFLNEQKPGSMTGRLENVDRLFTGEIGPLAGLIGPKARIWARYRFANVLYGIGSGYLSDLAAIPKTSTADFSTDDLLEYLSKIEVEIEPQEGRTFGDYRLAILEAAGITAAQMDLAHEGDVMNEGSYGRGSALELLEQINAATGSRHFVRTGITEETWAQYVVVDRWHKLDQPAPDVEIDDIRHIERDSFSGWRTAWDTIVNRQSIHVTHPPTYDNDIATVWEADLPISVAPSSTRVIWANNIGPVAEASLVISGSGISSSTLTMFADAAKIEISAGGSDAVVTALSITGRPGIGGPATTVIADDSVSQGIYGLREGPARTGVGLSETLAKGLAEHMVDRYGVPRRQPAVGMVDEKFKVLGRDLFDLVGMTASSVDVADRRMEIIGEELVYSSGDILTAQWQIQERPIQSRSVVDTTQVGDPILSI